MPGIVPWHKSAVKIREYLTLSDRMMMGICMKCEDIETITEGATP